MYMLILFLYIFFNYLTSQFEEFWRNYQKNVRVCRNDFVSTSYASRLGLIFNNYDFPTYYSFVLKITVSLPFALFYKHNHYTKLYTSKLRDHGDLFPIRSTVAFVTLLLTFENCFNRI